MKKFRGFLLKHRVSTLFRCFARRNRCSSGYARLDPLRTCKSKHISRLFSWGRRLKAICSRKRGPDYMRLGQDPVSDKLSAAVPKGHLAVYVGQKDGDFQRVLVPVIYINHPLFGQLLREAEEEYGFNHPGGITIPCRISEFESVQTRIAKGRVGLKMLTWKQHG